MRISLLRVLSQRVDRLTVITQPPPLHDNQHQKKNFAKLINKVRTGKSAIAPNIPSFSSRASHAQLQSKNISFNIPNKLKSA